MTKINAIVLAGDGKKESVKPGVENKALLSISGKPMVEYVVDALRATPEIGQISIIGPTEILRGHLGDKVDFYIDGKESLFDNLNAGIEPFKNDKAALVVTSDIPMITGEMVSDFIDRCENTDGDLCYPIVEKKINEERFPGITRTYVRLREGTFTGGNIFYVNPAVVEKCEEFARKIIAYRKKPLKTAHLMGVTFLIRLLLGLLSIRSVEKRFSKLLDITGYAIVTPHPELGNDVDKPSDVEMVQRYFSNRNV